MKADNASHLVNSVSRLERCSNQTFLSSCPATPPLERCDHLMVKTFSQNSLLCRFNNHHFQF